MSLTQNTLNYFSKINHHDRLAGKNCWATPPSLIALLQKHFCLEVEGMADALHHSGHLKEWYSLYQEDTIFGAKHDFFQQELAGKKHLHQSAIQTFEGNQILL